MSKTKINHKQTWVTVTPKLDNRMIENGKHFVAFEVEMYSKTFSSKEKAEKFANKMKPKFEKAINKFSNR